MYLWGAASWVPWLVRRSGLPKVWASLVAKPVVCCPSLPYLLSAVFSFVSFVFQRSKIERWLFFLVHPVPRAETPSTEKRVMPCLSWNLRSFEDLVDALPLLKPATFRGFGRPSIQTDFVTHSNTQMTPGTQNEDVLRGIFFFDIWLELIIKRRWCNPSCNHYLSRLPHPPMWATCFKILGNSNFCYRCSVFWVGTVQMTLSIGLHCVLAHASRENDRHIVPTSKRTLALSFVDTTQNNHRWHSCPLASHVSPLFCWTKHRILPWYGHNVETGQLPPTRLGRILLNGWLFECKIINQTMNYNHEKITVCSTAQTSVWSMSTDPFRKCGCHPKCYSPHVCNSNKFIWKHHQTMRSSCPNREMLQWKFLIRSKMLEQPNVASNFRVPKWAMVTIWYSCNLVVIRRPLRSTCVREIFVAILLGRIAEHGWNVRSLCAHEATNPSPTIFDDETDESLWVGEKSPTTARNYT